jgi:hypothetical protein
VGEKVPKDQRLLLQDNKHVSTKVESRETWKNTASPCWHLAQRTLLVRGRVGSDATSWRTCVLSSALWNTSFRYTQLLSATSYPHTKTPVSLSSRCCNILCNIVCRIRRGVCFRNRAECYWPDGRNSGMHRAAPSVPCLLWGKVCCCCDTRNVSVPMLSKTNYHYKHLDLHANIHHNSNRDGRESYI